MDGTADVVVIGAGVHGASTAFHLAERGARVIILEQTTLGAGATGRSSGLVRMHYDFAAESALAWKSFEYFRDWPNRVGGESGFVRTGFLRIVAPEHESAMRANVADQQQLGVQTSVISAADVADMFPALSTTDFDFAAYEPDSGYADPTSVCASLIAGARRHGAELAQGTGVEKITVEGDRVTGVQTSDGAFVSAPVVVLAAGAWSGVLAATAGVEIDVRAWHHDTGFVTLPAAISHDALPTVIDDINALYFRPEGRELALVGLEDGNRIDDLPADDSRSDPDFVDHFVERLCRRVPAFAQAEFRGAHGGTDGFTADQRPLLGAYGPHGLVLQCGFSGTGFKIAPAVGLALSELILEGESHSVDISVFDPGRFSAGRPIVAVRSYGDFWR